MNKERKSKNVLVVAAPKIAGKHDDYFDALSRSVWLASAFLRGEKGQHKNTAHSESVISKNLNFQRQLRIKRSLHGIAPRAVDKMSRMLQRQQSNKLNRFS